METPSPDRCATLKAHKVLPRRRVVSEELDQRSARAAGTRRSYTSPAKEAQITSWIRDATPPSPADQTFLLPLTPPDDEATLLPSNSQTLQTQATVAKMPALQIQANPMSGSTTPVNHRGPLTPDLTPPRPVKVRKRSPSPPLRRRKRNNFSPAPTSRQVSSAAESFRTAQEHMSPNTGDESRELVRAFQTPTPPQEPSSARTTTVSIGLGLGIGLNDDGVGTPTPAVLMPLNDSLQMIDDMRDVKSRTPNVVKSDPLIAREASAVQELAREVPLKHKEDDLAELPAVSCIEDHNIPYKDRSLTGEPRQLHDGLVQSPLSSKFSVSPVSDGSTNNDPLMERAKEDHKRYSLVSNLSIAQPVEVLVIDHTPRRKHKLKHARNVPSLREASSTQGDSTRSSLQSSVDIKPRLNHMLVRLPDRTAGSSQHSDSGISMGVSDHIMKRWSRMPSTEIPRRTPSIAYSLPHVDDRYNHPLSSKQASRPTTAPTTAPTAPSLTPELRRVKKRTFSEDSTVANEPRQEAEPTNGTDSRPTPITRQSSSLNAATNVDQSKSASHSASQQSSLSVTRVNGHFRSISSPLSQSHLPVRPNHGARNLSGESSTSSQYFSPPVKSPGSDAQLSPRLPLWLRRSSDASEHRVLLTRTTTPHRAAKEDPALLASRALLTTPFSGKSMQSSMSGNYEVHEATAINIYPHTNSSLLVIQQSSPTSLDFPAHPGVRPHGYRVAEITTSPTFPEHGQQQQQPPESMHVTISGPNGTPILALGDSFSEHGHALDSPWLRSPRPAPPSPQTSTLPAVNLIPPTPLDMPTITSGSGEQRPSTAPTRVAVVNGPISLVRRALSGRRTSSAAGGVLRTSGFGLTKGRRKKWSSGGGRSVKKSKKERPHVKDDNLSPFWRPRRFWDEEDEEAEQAEQAEEGGNYEGDELGKNTPVVGNANVAGPIRKLNSGHADAADAAATKARIYSLIGTADRVNAPTVAALAEEEEEAGKDGDDDDDKNEAKNRNNGDVNDDDYFTRPVRNTLGFPQQKIVITGPTSLVRRLSSIRRYRRTIALASPQPPARAGSLIKGDRSASLSKVSLAGANASEGRLRRKKIMFIPGKRGVRFEFNPMRGLTGTSGETEGWAGKGKVGRVVEGRREKKEAKEKTEMKEVEGKTRREEERREQRRMQLKGMIGPPRLEQVTERDFAVDAGSLR